MTPQDIARARMYTQLIAHKTEAQNPVEAVRHMGAMQAQDYLGALWAVGLRVKNGTEKKVEKALADGEIIRTWPMRGTLHFVVAEDARWMLRLLTSRVISRSKSRERELGVHADVLKKSEKVLQKALAGKNALSRPTLYKVFENEGLPHKNSAGLHIIGHLAMNQLICFGPRDGKQQTFVLFDEWVKKNRNLEGDDALAELAVRYFTSHGPAQLIDLMWWSGLTKKEAETAVEAAGKKLQKEIVEEKAYFMSSHLEVPEASGEAHFLPPFDEFLVSYKDRSPSLEAAHAMHVNPGANGMFNAIVVMDGQVLGTWKRTLKKDSVEIKSAAFKAFTSTQKELLETAAEKYGSFLGLRVAIT